MDEPTPFDIEAETLADQAARLADIAAVLDALPGADGEGISQLQRIQLFAVLEDQSQPHWFTAQRMHITRRHTLRVAVMRHCRIGLHVIPTEHQLMSALKAAANKIHP